MIIFLKIINWLLFATDMHCIFLEGTEVSITKCILNEVGPVMSSA